MHIDLFSMVILIIASAYIVGFFLICPIGMMRESVKMAEVEHGILHALERKLPVIYGEKEMGRPPQTHDLKYRSDNTLGGIIDGMVRSCLVDRIADIPKKQWNIVRHSA